VKGSEVKDSSASRAVRWLPLAGLVGLAYLIITAAPCPGGPLFHSFRIRNGRRPKGRAARPGGEGKIRFVFISI
jgi:hypothetical protein